MKRAAVIFGVGILTLTACNRERAARYETLGRQMHNPVAYFCRLDRHFQEGGGSNYDSMSRRTAIEAQNAYKGADQFIDVPKFSEPETEAELEEVRVLARRVKEVIGSACLGDIDPYAPPSPATLHCAELARTSPIGPMLEAVKRLAVDAKKRAGATLPQPVDEWCVIRK